MHPSGDDAKFQVMAMAGGGGAHVMPPATAFICPGQGSVCALSGLPLTEHWRAEHIISHDCLPTQAADTALTRSNVHPAGASVPSLQDPWIKPYMQTGKLVMICDPWQHNTRWSPPFGVGGGGDSGTTPQVSVFARRSASDISHTPGRASTSVMLPSSSTRTVPDTRLQGGVVLGVQGP
jgi:hypothetical protein